MARYKKHFFSAAQKARHLVTGYLLARYKTLLQETLIVTGNNVARYKKHFFLAAQKARHLVTGYLLARYKEPPMHNLL